MKKTACLLALTLVIFIAWCWISTNKINITDTEFHVESCDKYFELMDCILDNENNEERDQESRDVIRSDIKTLQNMWNNLDEKTLDDKCSSELENFNRYWEVLENVWCPVN